MKPETQKHGDDRGEDGRGRQQDRRVVPRQRSYAQSTLRQGPLSAMPVSFVDRQGTEARAEANFLSILVR